MAATISGFQTNELKPQPGLQIRRTENGGWEASHEIYIKADDFLTASASFAKGQLLSGIDTNIPAPFNDFLTIDTISFTRTEGDLIVFQVTATGSGSGQFDSEELGADALPTYDLRGQLVDAPFAQHRKWRDLPDGDQRLLGSMLAEVIFYDNENQRLFTFFEDGTRQYLDEEFTEANARAFAVRIMRGETTYEKSTYTYTESTEGDQPLPQSQLNKLGLIATPRGNPQTPTGVFDFRQTSISQSQSGELYRTTIEWTMSDEGGHDTFLYED